MPLEVVEMGNGAPSSSSSRCAAAPGSIPSPKSTPSVAHAITSTTSTGAQPLGLGLRRWGLLPPAMALLADSSSAQLAVAAAIGDDEMEMDGVHVPSKGAAAHNRSVSAILLLWLL